MPTITALIIYPIKSCAGIALTEATLTSAGLRTQQANDREWMVVDLAGQFLTQRQIPQMALIVPHLDSQGLHLTAPGMPILDMPFVFPTWTPALVKVWDDNVIAQDCGDVTAEWFSTALNVPCRLVHFDPHSQRMASKKWTAGRAVPTLFSDGYPILMTSQASLDDLNKKLHAQGRATLPMNRFRPNIVIDGVEAFEEDYAETLSTEKIRLQPVKPCPRCPIPSIDQATGKPGPDPLDILQSYRINPKVDGGITFGMNTILLEGEGEILRVGEEIEITLAF
ncbi:MOSC domain-containing protein [Glaciimonas sp. PAMC28666]|uniref:MOSC domain-containing protein n=1 Tax=Glaciimonas sp. PAMC28666 TaxID=2807626 RepID=UPI00196527EC|nr:MOSC N-terminal beta barrel domain-containing protein [Glaciimonas sp. PAMC28666]QRX83754.1 MOSC N-terminal beta barrel domain-containing protein [Glaciimonas sp. PAMC28666]